MVSAFSNRSAMFRSMGDSSTEASGSLSRGVLLASPTENVAHFKAKSTPYAPPSPSDLIILINRAEIAGFRHFAAALKATLPAPAPQTEAVRHPRGGFTHAVPHGDGTCRIYKGWWSTMAKAVAALPRPTAFSHLNPQSK